MKFVFTKHARGKFRKFAKAGVRISQKDVIGAIKNPERLEKQLGTPKVIASGLTDPQHVLRVVFKIEDDIITVITFYPARKGRYYEA